MQVDVQVTTPVTSAEGEEKDDEARVDSARALALKRAALDRKQPMEAGSMRAKSGTEENRTAPVADEIAWTVTDVRVIGGYRLWVRFADSTEGEVDVSKLVLSADAGVFEALRNPAVFSRVHVDDGAIAWPGGLDLAPDAIYDQMKAHGHWIL